MKNKAKVGELFAFVKEVQETVFTLRRLFEQQDTAEFALITRVDQHVKAHSLLSCNEVSDYM